MSIKEIVNTLYKVYFGMKQILFSIIKIGLFLVITVLQGQSLKVKVIDEQTGMPISLATVKTGEKNGVITNEEGIFTLKKSQVNKIKDSLFISYIGYETKGFLIKDITEGIIKLTPKSVELKEVFLDLKNYSIDEIIALIKKNLISNYNTNLSKKKIFFRQSDIHTIKKMDVEFVKSTIEELNKDLIDSIVKAVPKKFEFYREAVGDLYGDYMKHKLFIDKGAVLYDKKADDSMDGLLNRMETIFKENVKPNSYLKIKSGWFGTKTDLNSIFNSDGYARLKIENTDNQIFQKQVKDTISHLYSQLFFHKDSKLDFIRKSNRYEFEKDDYTFIDDEPVYKIKFSPKGRKHFKGVMYVNTKDFAIIRIDFSIIRPLRTFNLLGLNYRHNLFKGKMLFSRNIQEKYNLKYVEVESGSTFGAKRPLRIKEKNKYVKGKRKQNEFAIKLDAQLTSYHKYELVVYDSEDITSTNFKNVLENSKIEPEYLSQYNPLFWSGYNIIEPNKAIQSFKRIEE